MIELSEIYNGIGLRLGRHGLVGLHEYSGDKQTDDFVRDSRGRFAKIRGRSVFIANDTPGPEAFDKLKPPERAPEDDKKRVAYKAQGGGQIERAVYSDDWLKRTATYKFAKVVEIEKTRDKIESALEKEIKAELKSKFPPSSGFAVAAAALLIARTGLRPGNPDQGTRKKSGPDKGQLEKTFGATTLERQHVSVTGDTINFRFKGKSGVQRDFDVRDPVLAKAMDKLLQGTANDSDPIFSAQGRRVSEKAVGERFKAFNEHFKTKDFRTAVAMNIAAETVGAKLAAGTPEIPKDPKKAKKLAIQLTKELAKVVSEKLGNTPDVALKNYMNPAIVEHYLVASGFDLRALEEASGDALKAGSVPFAPGDLKVLTAVFGDEVVRDWCAAFLSDDNSDIDDAQ